MLSKWFWRGFLRGLTKPWSIFTDPPGYWQKKIRASDRVKESIDGC